MAGNDEATHRRLEFPDLLALLARHTSFPPGRAAALALRPSADAAVVRRLQAETSAARVFIEAGSALPLGGARDIGPALQHLQRDGVLDGPRLVTVADTAAAMGRVRQALIHDQHQELVDLVADLVPQPDLVKKLRHTLDGDGQVRDGASPQLADLRRQMRSLQERVRERLAGFLRAAAARFLQERLVTLREGRYVLPVRSEYRGQVPGVVHGQSASGATVFIEPAGVVELNNRLRVAAGAEEREVQRILTSLSRQVAGRADQLKHGLATLAAVDLVFARARLAAEQRATAPEIIDTAGAVLPAARHPLLGAAAVPIDVDIGFDFDLLVITGPNTGGKTVALKTVGLLVLMAQAGLHLPTAAGAKVGVFGQVLADIGDEQSIQQSLSTFSAHMGSIVDFVRRADDRTLILLDELGSGTDPDEGAALAIALLQYFRQVGARTIATTHHSRLKAFVLSEPRAVNAAVAFDPQTLAPTYHLLIGIPGRSHALTIAARLGMPPAILAAAREQLDPSAGRLEAAIVGAEDAQRQLEQERQQLAVEKAAVADLRTQLEEKLADLATRRQRWLTTTRTEVTAELNELLAAAGALLTDLRRGADEGAGERVGEATRRRLAQIRQGVSAALNRVAAEADADDVEADGAMLAAPAADAAGQPFTAVGRPGGPSAPETGVGWPPTPGDPVWVPSLQQVGELQRYTDHGQAAIIQLGALTMRVDLASLRPPPAGTAPPPPPAPALGADAGPARLAAAKTASIAVELHLRGLTAEEALARLDKYLDDALLAGLREVRIIHGKGTGTLRREITRFLASDARVTAAALAPAPEGGIGVTVATLS